MPEISMEAISSLRTGAYYEFSRPVWLHAANTPPHARMWELCNFYRCQNRVREGSPPFCVPRANNRNCSGLLYNERARDINPVAAAARFIRSSEHTDNNNNDEPRSRVLCTDRGVGHTLNLYIYVLFLCRSTYARRSQVTAAAAAATNLRFAVLSFFLSFT
uniref:Uncharacterized protein n=1 Tax=Trichogramma kaykai TaxID=54128 RepID=A0ABD2WID3_9HYME